MTRNLVFFNRKLIIVEYLYWERKEVREETHYIDIFVCIDACTHTSSPMLKLLKAKNTIFLQPPSNVITLAYALGMQLWFMNLAIPPFLVASTMSFQRAERETEGPI